MKPDVLNRLQLLSPTRLTTACLVFALDACGGSSTAPADARWGSVVSTAQIVFMATSGPQAVPGGGDPGAWELVVMNLDGSGRKQATSNKEQEFLPHFSPEIGRAHV